MQMETIIQWVKTLRAAAQGHRVLITLLAALVFAVGIVWALQTASIDWTVIDWRWIAFISLVLVPASVVAAAINLQLLAKAIGTAIPLHRSVMVTAYGRVAELLPIPGAVIVRGAALMHSGATAADTAKVLAWSGLLTLGMAGLVSAIPLYSSYLLLAVGMSLVSGAISAVSLRWLWRKLSMSGVAAMVAVRLAMLAISIVRFWACFIALGAIVPFIDAAVFVIGGTLTTLIGIVPGGLGISEGISAAVALMVGIPAALAFLSAALNRLLGLAGSALVALLFWLAGSRQGQELHG